VQSKLSLNPSIRHTIKTFIEGTQFGVINLSSKPIHLGESKTLNPSLKTPNLAQSNLHETHPFGAIKGTQFGTIKAFIEGTQIWHNQTFIKPIHLVQSKDSMKATQFCTIKRSSNPSIWCNQNLHQKME
jgi:hypothetical protein